MLRQVGPKALVGTPKIDVHTPLLPLANQPLPYQTQVLSQAVRRGKGCGVVNTHLQLPSPSCCQNPQRPGFQVLPQTGLCLSPSSVDVLLSSQ